MSEAYTFLKNLAESGFCSWRKYNFYYNTVFVMLLAELVAFLMSSTLASC